MSDLVKRAFQLMGIEEPEPVVQATPAESDPVPVEMAVSRIFKDALDELKAGWIPDLLTHIQRKHPDQWTRIRAAEDALETTWQGALRETATVADFGEAVSVWKDAYMDMIHEHRKQDCRDCPPDKQAACHNRCQ